MKFAGAKRTVASRDPVAAAVVSREEVARLAYELYEQSGRRDGHDLEKWITAEAILRERKNAHSAP